MAVFVEVSSEDVLDNPQAYNWLLEAAENFGGVAYLREILASGEKKCVFVKKETKLLGALIIIFSQQHMGRIMTLALLGGCELSDWSKELSDYLYSVAHQEKADQFFYFGRKGFSKYWPELLEVARVYRVVLNHKS